MRALAAIALFCVATLALAQESERPLVVGSKNFNESYVLGEIVAQMLESEGFAVERKFGLGGTLICYSALEEGEIDVYVEYTGTLAQAILKLPADAAELDTLNGSIAERGLEMLPAFGFNNTYAMVVREAFAQQLGLNTIGDLNGVADVRLVVSHEFLEREDGWPGLSAAYGLRQPVRGIEHGLAYQAIHEGSIDVTDAYSTDGELQRYSLRVLEDDRGFFPRYLAAPLIRSDLPDGARRALLKLADTLTDAQMQQLNSRVVFGGETFAEVANGYLASIGVSYEVAGDGFWQELAVNTRRHLALTGVALAAAIFAGVGLALMVFRRPALSNAVVYVCGLLQTIPSIALLALMIPLFGIGFLPAIVALFLYSLLPILRNAVTALTTVDPTLIKVANAMGLTQREQLRHLYVPLALPSIFAGVRTAAVISIGTATLAAFIGAGGLGDPIVTGLSLNDVSLILRGAIPAALLAVITELIFEAVERRVLPGHLRK